MNTVKVNVSKLSGAALDWCVAKCEGYEPVYTRHYVTPSHAEDPKKICIPAPSWMQPFEPSINWAQGGQIIEREGSINGWSTYYDPQCAWVSFPASSVWVCICQRNRTRCAGETLLVAAMRCYVASKLGEVVEVPAELLK